MESRFEQRLARALPYITAIGVAVMLASLKFGFLDTFFPTTWHGRPAFDFFSVPRAYDNLMHGRSIYNTWVSSYGPYATWYPYHPSLAFFVGSWTWLLPPWTAYALFTALALVSLLFCARLIAASAQSGVERGLVYFILFCSPPMYLLLWNGQMHIFTVISFALVMVDLLELSEKPGSGGAIRQKMLWGLLVSLLSKPMILAAVPALLAVKAARKTLLLALVLYALVSGLFYFTPALNPQKVSFQRAAQAVLRPNTIFSYKVNGQQVNVSYREDIVKDNLMHWLNMRNLFGVSRADNFEFFSLPGYVQHVTGDAVSMKLFKLPGLLLLALSLAIFLLKDGAAQARAALMACVFAVCAFFLSYDSAYEYHYATLMPSIPLLIMLYRRGGEGFNRKALLIYCLAAAILLVPTPYHWLRNPSFGHSSELAQLPMWSILVYMGSKTYDYFLPLLRLWRVLPVTLMAVASCWLLADYLKKNLEKNG